MNVKNSIVKKSIMNLFEDYLRDKMWIDEEINLSSNVVQNYFDTILLLGLKRDQFLTANYPNRCHDVLFEGKPARADMLKRLGHVLYELKQAETFPAVAPSLVAIAVRKVIGNDNRYVQLYSKWINALTFFAPNEIRDNYNFAELIKIFPQDKIIKKVFFE